MGGGGGRGGERKEEEEEGDRVRSCEGGRERPASRQRPSLAQGEGSLPRTTSALYLCLIPLPCTSALYLCTCASHRQRRRSPPSSAAQPPQPPRTPLQPLRTPLQPPQPIQTLLQLPQPTPPLRKGRRSHLTLTASTPPSCSTCQLMHLDRLVGTIQPPLSFMVRDSFISCQTWHDDVFLKVSTHNGDGAPYPSPPQSASQCTWIDWSGQITIAPCPLAQNMPARWTPLPRMASRQCTLAFPHLLCILPATISLQIFHSPDALPTSLTPSPSPLPSPLPPPQHMQVRWTPL